MDNPDGADGHRLSQLLHVVEAMVQHRSTNRLTEVYSKPPSWEPDGTPYPWQVKFHNMQRTFRMLMAGNRVGKTETGTAEDAYHLTGLYPHWWEGRVFQYPPKVLVATTTNQMSHDSVQPKLLGAMSGTGSNRSPDGRGWIPLDKIGRCTVRNCGVTDVINEAKIKHASGDWSTLLFKTYQQGWVEFQAIDLDVVHFDEEPEDHRIYTEAITRLIDRDGIFMFTRTPLFGQTKLVKSFMGKEDSKTHGRVMVSWDDAPHISDTMKKTMLEEYPKHERQARSAGVPMLGSGAVYTVSEKELVTDAFKIPDHWFRLNGCDFGIDHPAAGVTMAWDADNDNYYLIDSYRKSDEQAPYHAERLKRWGDWIPTAWPHDGDVREKGTGQTLKDQYESSGANMLPISARWEIDKGGGQSVEGIVMFVQGLERSGRIKYFRQNAEFLGERQMYHRKDGKIVKKDDDIISAMHYCIMMLRLGFGARIGDFDRYKQDEGDYSDPLEGYR